MKKKKENKTIVQQKITLINDLLDKNFRCKDSNGKHLSISETDNILMNLPLDTITNISKRYEIVADNIMEIRRAIKPLYNAVMHKTGLSHFVNL